MDRSSAPYEPRRDNTTPSCAVCQRRKVKCSRTFPCNQCTKTGLECSFNPINRHRPKRVKRSNLSEVIDAEDEGTGSVHAPSSLPAGILQRREDVDASSRSTTSPSTARLVSEGSGYRYVNNHLWSSLPVQSTKSSPHSSAPAVSDSSTPPTRHRQGSVHGLHSRQDEHEGPFNHESGASLPDIRSFLFQQTPVRRAIEQPTPTQVVQLWQAYLTNVDPMMKVLHAPTVQQLVLGQIGKSALADDEQTLVSSIYFVSIVSLNDAECRTGLLEARDDLIRRFRHATEEALSNAAFVTSTDLAVLQALVLYLAALRSLGDAQTVWSLTGLAIRIAGTIGLARDGDFLDLPPFESEMRRRLWWAIVYLDARTAELVGQDGDLLVSNYDVKPPSNLNDSELNPTMSRLPESRTCSGEVVYVQLRATLALCLRSMPKLKGPGGTWQQMAGKALATGDKITLVENLEKQFRDEILDHCDPAVPLQKFTLNSASTFLNKMRLVAQIPESRARSQDGVSEGYSDDMFQLSTRLMKLQLEVFTEPCLQRWRWHWQGQFQWYALACLIRQTRLRKPGPETRHSWLIIRKVFDTIIPTLSLGSRQSPILDAIKSLLDNAMGYQEQPDQPPLSRPGDERTSIPDPNPVAISNITSPRPSPSMDSGGGSRPHNTLLPGMSQAHMAPPAGALNGVTSTESIDTEVNGISTDDAFLGIDFGAIDWVEFDRLTSELCAQQGS